MRKERERHGRPARRRPLLSAYIDTSILVAATTSEPDRDRAQAWLTYAADPLYISPWVVAEFASALSMKMRKGELDAIGRSAADGAFDRLQRSYLTMEAITAQHFEAATRFLQRHDLGLRSGDALHLAIAAELGVSLCTFDQRLAQAARVLGYRVETP